MPPVESATPASNGTATLLRTVLITTSALAFYFVTSIALTIFNKWLFAEKPKDPLAKQPLLISKYGFHFPLTVTCLHQLLVFAIVVSVSKLKFLTSRIGEVERSSSAFWTLVPIGALCGIDWGLSNTSLRSIPLSLYEMVKSSSPVVVLLFSFRFGMIKVTGSLAFIIILISVGTFLSVSGGDISVFASASFPLKGFIAVSIATLLSGTRVVLTQFALQRGGLDMIIGSLQRKRSAAVVPTNNSIGGSGVVGSPAVIVNSFPQLGSIPPTPTDMSPPPLGGQPSSLTFNSSSQLPAAPTISPGSNQTSTNANCGPTSGGASGPSCHGGFNTMTALFYCAPASAASLVLPALVFELADVIQWFNSASPVYISELSFWIIVTSVIAFLLSVAEFTVTGLTSALTMCVTGIAKQVLIVGLAMAIFGDHLGAVNVVGFSMSIIGISLYNYLKYKQAMGTQGYTNVPSDTSREDVGAANNNGGAPPSYIGGGVGYNSSAASPLANIPIGHTHISSVSSTIGGNTANPSTTLVGGSPMVGVGTGGAGGGSVTINTSLAHHFNNFSTNNRAGGGIGIEMHPMGSHTGSHRDSPVTQQANSIGKAVLRPSASLSKTQ